MNNEKCFGVMNNDEKLNYVADHGGYVEDDIGLNSDGHEFRCDCDCDGLTLNLKESEDEI
tara:strand:+ start:83 stop:262 length:180 start_codon:yes stop_codon:yes gene_type:complete